MEVIQYKTGKAPLEAYSSLIKSIYGASPCYAASLAEEALYQLAPENPFLSFGAREGFLATDGGAPAAHACAITDSRLPAGTGLIGYFDALGAEAAKGVIAAACANLAARGVNKIYGPVNDTTWQRYGVSIAGEAPPFSGEPFTPREYADYFENAGFSISDRRLSTSMAVGELPFEGYGNCYETLLKKGFTFAEVEPAALAPRAKEIYSIVNSAFGGTPLFVRSGFGEFLYSASARAGRAAGVIFLLAHDGQNKPAAFLMGMPDSCSGGENFIFKTIGVTAECRRMGMGRALFHLMHLRLRDGGAKKCIFSTMRDGNPGIQALTACAPVLHRGYLTFMKEI